jgi:cellulose synthase/poly-beta-1,6-N-acetylglucosamine synthase-like glycosyltransferase
MHHAVEQVTRANSFKRFGFNGTGGMWRKQAIEDVGYWQWDTLTEDLDISFLARIKGYKMVYLRDFPQQLENPDNFLDHKQQKNCWTKGFFQVLRKSMWNILCSPDLLLLLKSEAWFHMTGTITHPLNLITFSTVPLAAYRLTLTYLDMLFLISPLFPTIAVAIVAIYAKVPSSNGHYSTS